MARILNGWLFSNPWFIPVRWLKWAYLVPARSHYWTSVIVRIGSRLFHAYFSQRIWINHGFEDSQPLRIRANMTGFQREMSRPVANASGRVSSDWCVSHCTELHESAYKFRRICLPFKIAMLWNKTLCFSAKMLCSGTDFQSWKWVSLQHHILNTRYMLSAPPPDEIGIWGAFKSKCLVPWVKGLIL